MKKVSKGSPEQLIDMMSRKIDQLSGTAVDSCSQPVMSSHEGEAIYHFPKFTPEDRSVARREYDLTIVRETPQDTIVRGDMQNIQSFADEYLGYELNPDYLIEGCGCPDTQPVMSDDDIAENPAYEEIDDSSRDEYINNLIDSVEANIAGSGYSVSAENIPDEQRIVVTVSDMSSIVREYSIPYGDLNFEDVDADTEYCTNEILYDIDENNPDGTPREDAEEDPEDEFGHW